MNIHETTTRAQGRRLLAAGFPVETHMEGHKIVVEYIPLHKLWNEVHKLDRTYELPTSMNAATLIESLVCILEKHYAGIKAKDEAEEGELAKGTVTVELESGGEREIAIWLIEDYGAFCNPIDRTSLFDICPRYEPGPVHYFVRLRPFGDIVLITKESAETIFQIKHPSEK